MNPAELLELVSWLRAVFALLVVQVPLLVWLAAVLWRLERRLYTIELELGMVEKQ